MTAVPNALPSLAKGAHAPNSGQACVMEYVALLAGEPWTDSPTCTHPALARMAQVVNDRLPDSERHQLVPLIGRLFGTADTGDKKLSVQLAIWCAKRVLHLVRGEDRGVCAHAIATASRWVTGDATETECATAANAAYDANANDAAAAYAAYAYAAAAYDAYAAAAAANGNLVALLTDFLDEYDRLTGRTEHREVTPAELSDLSDLAHLVTAQ